MKPFSMISAIFFLLASITSFAASPKLLVCEGIVGNQGFNQRLELPADTGMFSTMYLPKLNGYVIYVMAVQLKTKPGMSIVIRKQNSNGHDYAFAHFPGDTLTYLGYVGDNAAQWDGSVSSSVNILCHLR